MATVATIGVLCYSIVYYIMSYYSLTLEEQLQAFTQRGGVRRELAGVLTYRTRH